MDRAWTGGERETARSARCHGERVGSRVVRRLTAAVPVTTCCTGAHAQSRSRAEVLALPPDEHGEVRRGARHPGH